MAAVFEKEKFGSVFRGVIKTDGAVAAEQITRDAATGAHAVDLVDAEVSAHIKLAPRFDEDGARGLLGQEKFQRRPFVFDVGDRGGGFEDLVIQTT